MGRVMTKVKLTNTVDVQEGERGLLRPDEVRQVEVEALVDTGATMLAVPRDVAEKLGLKERGRRRVRYADGRVADVPWVGPITVEILGRETMCEALVEAAGTTPLIGQIPLEALDLVVDPRTRDVSVNPASPDMPMMDLLGACC